MICFFKNLCSWLLIDTLASFAIATNPHHPGELWWSNWEGRLKKMCVSRNGAVEAMVVDSGFVGGRITNIVFHPRDPDVVFAAGLMMQGIYRSQDGGRTWRVILKNDSQQTTWYSGESVLIRQTPIGVLLIAANFSVGTVDWSWDLGNTWSSFNPKKTRAICSIELVSTDPLKVIAGCREGSIYEFDLTSGSSTLLWKSGKPHYVEIPRIRKSKTDSNEVLCVTAGFDSLKVIDGLMLSCDLSRTWESGYLPGMSVWALEQCTCGQHIALGGFSEFSSIKGAGHFVVLDVASGSSQSVDPGFGWKSKSPSVWDICTVRDSNNVPFGLALATESGVFVVKSCSQIQP